MGSFRRRQDGIPDYQAGAAHVRGRCGCRGGSGARGLRTRPVRQRPWPSGRRLWVALDHRSGPGRPCCPGSHRVRGGRDRVVSRSRTSCLGSRCATAFGSWISPSSRERTRQELWGARCAAIRIKGLKRLRYGVDLGHARALVLAYEVKESSVLGADSPKHLDQLFGALESTQPHWTQRSERSSKRLKPFRLTRLKQALALLLPGLAPYLVHQHPLASMASTIQRNPPGSAGALRLTGPCSANARGAAGKLRSCLARPDTAA